MEYYPYNTTQVIADTVSQFNRTNRSVFVLILLLISLFFVCLSTFRSVLHTFFERFDYYNKDYSKNMNNNDLYYNNDFDNYNNHNIGNE